MSLEEFAERIRGRLQEQLGGEKTVTLQRVMRNNGRERLALCILSDTDCTSPVIYLEEYCQREAAGTTEEEILAEILRLAQDAEGPPFAPRDFSVWNLIRGRVLAMLVNTAKNRKRLNECPHREILDLSLLYYLNIEMKGCLGGIAVIRNEHGRIWGVDEETLYRTAMENLQGQYPALCCPVTDAVSEILGESCLTGQDPGMKLPEELPEIMESPVPLYLLTNRRKSLGAVSVIYEGELKKQCLRQGWKRVFVLPSSIHEVLLFPDEKMFSAEKLRGIIREANREAVLEEDYLSDSLYFYDSETDVLRIEEAV